MSKTCVLLQIVVIIRVFDFTLEKNFVNMTLAIYHSELLSALLRQQFHQKWSDSLSIRIVQADSAKYTLDFMFLLLRNHEPELSNLSFDMGYLRVRMQYIVTICKVLNQCTIIYLYMWMCQNSHEPSQLFLIKSKTPFQFQ